MVVIFNFTIGVAMFFVIVLLHCSNFSLIKKLWISTRTLLLRETTDVEKFLISYFLFFLNLVLELHELLWPYVIIFFRYPIILNCINFVHERFFTFAKRLFGNRFLVSFIRCLFWDLHAIVCRVLRLSHLTFSVNDILSVSSSFNQVVHIYHGKRSTIFRTWFIIFSRGLILNYHFTLKLLTSFGVVGIILVSFTVSSLFTTNGFSDFQSIRSDWAVNISRVHHAIT